MVDKPPPMDAPPPPPYVPPPEVQPPPPPIAAPVIQAIQQVEPPPKPVEIKPPPPPAPPAPPPPAPAPPAVAKPEIGVACPNHKESLSASLAGAFDRIGITGVVKVNIKIKGNQIIEVVAVSGPREYYRMVQNGVRRLNCSSPQAEEVTVPLEISFKEQ